MNSTPKKCTHPYQSLSSYAAGSGNLDDISWCSECGSLRYSENGKLGNWVTPIFNHSVDNPKVTVYGIREIVNLESAKFYFHEAGGVLLCNTMLITRNADGTVRRLTELLSEELQRKYGAPFFIAESMTRAFAEAILSMMGKSLEKEPLINNSKGSEWGKHLATCAHCRPHGRPVCSFGKEIHNEEFGKDAG